MWVLFLFWGDFMSLFGNLSWWREYEEEQKRIKEEELKKIKCYRCVWFHKKAKFCPFKKCFKGKWGDW